MSLGDPATLGVDAWIGMGANLGNTCATLESARRALADLPASTLVRTSSYYRSAPVQADGPDFLNAVVRLRTPLSALDLLEHLLAIEDRHGRQRPYLNAPRHLDLDLLIHGNSIITSPRLTVPHPRAHLRAFVLAPLQELDPEFVVPGHGAVSMLLAACRDQRCERVACAA